MSTKIALKKDILTIPNILSFGRIVTLPLILVLTLKDDILLRNIGFFIYFLSCCTDFIDGYIARRYNLISTTGKLLDPLADKFTVLLPLLLLLYMKEISLILVLLIFARELYIIGIRDLAIEKSIIIPADQSGKIKALMQMFGVGFYISTAEFYSFFFRIHIDPVFFGTILLWSSLIFAYYSAYNYTMIVKKNVFEGNVNNPK